MVVTHFILYTQFFPPISHPSGCYKNVHLSFMMGVIATIWGAIHFYGNQNANSCGLGRADSDGNRIIRR